MAGMDKYVVDPELVTKASGTVTIAAGQVNFGNGRFAELANLSNAVKWEPAVPSSGGSGGNSGPYGSAEIDGINEQVEKLINGPYQEVVASAARFIKRAKDNLDQVSVTMTDTAKDYRGDDEKHARDVRSVYPDGRLW